MARECMPAGPRGPRNEVCQELRELWANAGVSMLGGRSRLAVRPVSQMGDHVHSLGTGAMGLVSMQGASASFMHSARNQDDGTLVHPRGFANAWGRALAFRCPHGAQVDGQQLCEGRLEWMHARLARWMQGPPRLLARRLSCELCLPAWDLRLCRLWTSRALEVLAPIGGGGVVSGPNVRQRGSNRRQCIWNHSFCQL